MPQVENSIFNPSLQKYKQKEIVKKSTNEIFSGCRDDNIYTSLETLNNTTTHSERYPFKSKPSRHNPNVLFRRPNDMPSGILY